jgi:hypothetical protein
MRMQCMTGRKGMPALGCFRAEQDVSLHRIISYDEAIGIVSKELLW